ncbi:hypothetical protein [Acetobacter senegalensis]|nr:hypothetical protein [Acetobacter senegalensis]
MSDSRLTTPNRFGTVCGTPVLIFSPTPTCCRTVPRFFHGHGFF